jgi:hypothetical protein
VATALFEACCRLAQDKGLGAVECMALSFYTQRICAKLGFQEHFRFEQEQAFALWLSEA